MRDIERGRVLCTIEGYVLWKKMFYLCLSHRLC